MLEDRETQINFDGSLSLSFADQVIFDMNEYFNHYDELSKKEELYTSGRKVRVEIFYESFFISNYAYLESMTGQVCDDLATILHKNVRLRDLNERSKFDGIRKYLSLLSDIEFPSNNVFMSLKGYRKVRNILAHGNNLTVLETKDEKMIENLSGISRNEEGGLVISPKFCRDFILFCNLYIVELKVIAAEISGRAKRKVTVVT
jgi:hypothetical protein